MFRLLDQFSSERNQFAPVLYKTLIFSLIENHQDLLTREFMLANFAYLFERLPTIPIGILIEPLTKQLQVSDNLTYYYNVFDFDFFVVLSRHPKLTLKSAVPLLDMMAKIYLNDHDYAGAASVPFMLIVSRFILSEAIPEFVAKFLTVSPKSFLILAAGICQPTRA